MRHCTAPFLQSVSGGLCFLFLLGCLVDQQEAASKLLPKSPLETTYRVDGETITLHNGDASRQYAPDSASTLRVMVTGETASGDLNGDGLTETALVLSKSTGGSGTFYYLAAVSNENEEAEAVQTVFLGDRIQPENLLVEHGLVIFDFKDRLPDEPMAAPPSVNKSKYFLFDGQVLHEIPLDPGELIIAGEVILGHEVWTLRPCGEPEPYWITGASTALAPLRVVYHQSTSDASPYSPLFMVVIGRLSKPSSDGLGSAYPVAIRLTRLIKVLPGKRCGQE